jgi:hypothetical protein
MLAGAAGFVCILIGVSFFVLRAYVHGPVLPIITLPQRPDGAAQLYLEARAAITVHCPAETNTVWPDYPPDSPQWRQLAAAAWDADALVRDLVRQTAPMQQFNRLIARDALGNLRRVANHIGDSALYAHAQGDESQAIDLIGDMLHMSALLENSPTSGRLQMIVGIGVSALAMYDLMLINTCVELSDDPQNARDLQVRTARELIARLLNRQRDPRKSLADAYRAEGAIDNPSYAASDKRFLESCNHINTEQSLAAMSLACHIFRFEKNRWPNSLDELIPNYLPKATIDPWGDGKQTLGYVLIKGGLPDGSDRPLVYSRCMSPDGLFYMLNEPQYGFYTHDDGSSRSWGQMKQGGQYRDVARWERVANYKGPTTRPLP